MNPLVLPLEIIELIISFTDYETILKCRDITSNHFNEITKYSNYPSVIKNNNLKNLKWLYKTHHNELVLNLCIKYNNLEFFKIFYKTETENISQIFLSIKYKRLEFIEFLKDKISQKTKNILSEWVSLLRLENNKLYQKLL